MRPKVTHFPSATWGEFMRITIALILLALAAAPAAAAVEESSPGGFILRNQAVVAASPSETWAMLGRVGQWWNKDHTYSGDAANMRLDLRAGGCFCERVAAWKGATGVGEVEHGRVLTALPGALLVLDAPLGPLQTQALVGRLTWTLRAVDGGTEVTQGFAAGGYARGGADKLAPIVDKVLAEQLEGLKRRLAR
jgi:uncharacterized protein YndB with AHSA1/START domain